MLALGKRLSAGLLQGEERTRLEALAEKAAGAPDFVADRRREQEVAARISELTARGLEEAAPDVLLPGRVLAWLDLGAPQAPHGLFESGVLAVLKKAFATGKPPVSGSVFREGWLALPEGFEFPGCEWPNDGARCRAAVARLSRNGLLDIEERPGATLVRLRKTSRKR